MAEHSRYNVGKDDDHEVLPNKLKITDLKTLEDVETLLFSDAYNHLLERLKAGKLKFNVKLIFQIHKYFLIQIVGISRLKINTHFFSSLRG